MITSGRMPEAWIRYLSAPTSKDPHGARSGTHKDVGSAHGVRPPLWREAPNANSAWRSSVFHEFVRCLGKGVEDGSLLFGLEPPVWSG